MPNVKRFAYIYGTVVYTDSFAAAHGIVAEVFAF